jgi:hypothetical protein
MPSRYAPCMHRSVTRSRTLKRRWMTCASRSLGVATRRGTSNGRRQCRGSSSSMRDGSASPSSPSAWGMDVDVQLVDVLVDGRVRLAMHRRARGARRSR